MRKIIATCVMSTAFALGGCGHAELTSPRYSLSEIQGAWWADCDQPAVELFIERDEYSGDFLGRHKLSLENNVLTLKDGLLPNHDIYVSGKPLVFLVVEVSKSELVLRPKNRPEDSDWRLRRCKMPPNNSFKPKPLRGSA